MVEVVKEYSNPGIPREACVLWLKNNLEVSDKAVQKIITQLEVIISTETAETLRLEYEEASPLEKLKVIDQVGALLSKSD